MVHGIPPHSSTTAAPSASSSSAYADNNNHSQYSALHNLHNHSRYAQEQPDPYWDDTADSRRYTERRKKQVRFDQKDSEQERQQDRQTQPQQQQQQQQERRQEIDEWTRWETERQGSQDSATKDSGIDSTSSTFTSSEDSNRGDGPKVPSLFSCPFSIS